MSCKPCPVGQELVEAEAQARQKASAAFKAHANSYVGLSHTQAAVDYARTYEMHVRLDECQQCGMAYSEAFVKEMVAR